jgi:hypothetical protein
MIRKTNTEIQRDGKREMVRENGFRKASKEGNRSIIQKSSSHTCTDNTLYTVHIVCQWQQYPKITIQTNKQMTGNVIFCQGCYQ